MVYGALYLIVFLLGLFVVWVLARKEYYDEEKVIDLCLLSTVVGLLVARLSFFFTATGSSEWSIITGGDSVWFGLIRFFQLGNGVVAWMGIVAFILTATYLFIRWSWPFWPVLGFVTLGSSLAGLLYELLFYFQFKSLHNDGVVAVGLLLCGLLVIYEYFLGGSKLLASFKKGFMKTFSENMNQPKDEVPEETLKD